jgi:hypothetical protein
MLKTLACVCTALIFGSLQARAHDGNNGFVTLSGVYTLWSNTYAGDTIRIVVTSLDYYNPAGSACTNVDSYMVSSAISAEARQRIYSTLLAAKMAGKPVKLSLDTNYCEQARPRVLNVTLD